MQKYYDTCYITIYSGIVTLNFETFNPFAQNFLSFSIVEIMRFISYNYYLCESENISHGLHKIAIKLLEFVLQLT